MNPKAPVSPSKSGPDSKGKSSPINSSKKRKRIVLSIEQKQEILERLLEDGERPGLIADDYGISQQQISDIKKNKTRITEYVQESEAPGRLKRKTMKSPTFPSVELTLYRWYRAQMDEGKEVTNADLTVQAQKIQAETKKSKDPPFKASISWLRAFKERYEIKKVSTSKKTLEAGAVQVQKGSRVAALEARMEALEKLTNERIAKLEEQVEDLMAQMDGNAKRATRLV